MRPAKRGLCGVRPSTRFAVACERSPVDPSGEMEVSPLLIRPTGSRRPFSSQDVICASVLDLSAGWCWACLGCGSCPRPSTFHPERAEGEWCSSRLRGRSNWKVGTQFLAPVADRDLRDRCAGSSRLYRQAYRPLTQSRIHANLPVAGSEQFCGSRRSRPAERFRCAKASSFRASAVE